jgi:HEAT repeat protein
MDVRLHTLALMAALAFTIGCGREAIRPSKTVTVPAGEKPVLTSVERPVQPPLEPQPSSNVARATFEQPIPEPEPIKPLAAWTEQEAAAEALGRIGAAAVPALVETLNSPDPAARLKGVEVLGRMGADARDAVPQLVRLLDDPDPAVRKAAARTLGRIGPAAHEAVPSLMKSLLQPTPPPSPNPQP